VYNKALDRRRLSILVVVEPKCE